MLRVVFSALLLVSDSGQWAEQGGGRRVSLCVCVRHVDMRVWRGGCNASSRRLGSVRACSMVNVNVNGFSVRHGMLHFTRAAIFVERAD